MVVEDDVSFLTVILVIGLFLICFYIAHWFFLVMDNLKKSQTLFASLGDFFEIKQRGEIVNEEEE